MNDPRKISQLLKKAEQATRAYSAEIKSLKAKIAADEPKLEELEKLRSWKAKVEECQKIASRMVETDQISIEDRDERIASLMKMNDEELKVTKEAVELVADGGSIGQLDKEASEGDGNAFWETWNTFGN